MSYWDPCTVTTPTARKEHRCSGCCDTIKPGEKYTLTSGCYDGDWAAWKDCGRCIPMDGPHGWWARPEQVLDDVSDYYWWDGVIIAPDARHRHRTDQRQDYEAIIVPLVGLMEWVEVAG